MGQYRLSVYLEWSLGFWVGYDPQPRMLNIRIPLLAIHVGLEKHANGYRFPWT